METVIKIENISSHNCGKIVPSPVYTHLANDVLWINYLMKTYISYANWMGNSLASQRQEYPEGFQSSK